MKKLDINKVLEDFGTKITNGELIKDTLPNSFSKFTGSLEQSEKDSFNRFRNTEVYKMILDM